MERKYVFGIVAISFILTNVVAYLDEGIRTLEYLTKLGDWIALIIYTILFSIIPVFIFFLGKRALKTRFLKSLLGFIPAVLLIIIQL